MSVKKVYDKQPDTFEFTKENLVLAENILNKYPKERKKSAVMPLLYLAQNQNDNWIPLAALKYIGKFLSMPYINVYEIATFYSMYNLSPVGKYFVQVCTTTPCLLRGANEIVKACQKKISKNESEKIFQKGFRGSASKKKDGTGVGLFLARKLAQQIGGDLKLLERSYINEIEQLKNFKKKNHWYYVS